MSETFLRIDTTLLSGESLSFKLKDYLEKIATRAEESSRHSGYQPKRTLARLSRRRLFEERLSSSRASYVSILSRRRIELFYEETFCHLFYPAYRPLLLFLHNETTKARLRNRLLRKFLSSLVDSTTIFSTIFHSSYEHLRSHIKFEKKGCSFEKNESTFEPALDPLFNYSRALFTFPSREGRDVST